MSSDKIDKWIKKEPESWAKLADLNKKTTFKQFKKKFRQGANQQGKGHILKHMTNQQLKYIHEKSGYAKKTTTKTDYIIPKEKPFKPKTIIVKRKGKTYKKTINPNWKPTDNFALTIAAQTKPRTKQYNEYVKTLTQTTGRSRQAVTKKIWRIRQTLSNSD